MANAFLNGLQRFGVGFGAGLAGGGVGQQILADFQAKQAMERQQEMMNPFRSAVLDQLRGPRNVFEGGPASDFVADPGQPFPPGEDVSRGTPADAPAVVQGRPLPKGLPDELQPPPEIDVVLRRAAARHGVPVNALRTLAAQESSFRPDARNEPTPGDPTDPGAVGLFQFIAPTAQAMGIDPTDAAQSADAAARMLRRELDKGSTIEEAMTAHFGGPNRSSWGPKTQQYARDVAQKYRLYEQASPEAPPTAPQGAQQAAGGASVGPFGSVVRPMQQPQGFGQRMLEEAAKDPGTFAQMFSGEGGIESLQALLQGTEAEQTRVVSGDTAMGRSIGLRPGERARVQGTVDARGNFLPQNVQANPFGETQSNEGPLVSLYDLDSGELVTRRRDDPEVDSLVQRGMVLVNDGAALSRLNDMSSSERGKLNEAQISTRNYIDTVRDGLEMLSQQPDINTFIGKAASLVNDFRQEAKAFARSTGVEFDEGIFDVSVHEDSFRQLGIDNQRMQSLITSLAFQRAAAEKGGQGRISNRDIERFIAEVGGGSSDPVSLAQTLVDTARRAARQFETRYEVSTGGAFAGDLGLDRLPSLSADQFEQRANDAAGVGRPPAPAAAVGGETDPVQISSDAEYDALPSGTTFIAPDGTTRRKP